MQSVRSAPSASSSRRYSERTLRTRAIGRGRSRRRSSTPSPSRVIVSRRTTSSSAPVDVGDEETGRVRPQVDGRDPHLRGTNAGHPVDRRAHVRERGREDVQLARARCAGARATPPAARRSRPPASRWRSISAVDAVIAVELRADVRLEPFERPEGFEARQRYVDQGGNSEDDGNRERKPEEALRRC